MNPPEDAVSDCVQRYLDGLFHADAELLRAVMHERCRLYSAAGG